MKSVKRMLATLAVVVLALAWACPAGEIGYEEDFALAKDRAAALKQLIPGTQEYYYYHCLHYQNLGQLDKVDEMLQPWIGRYKRTALVQEIENRQALLKYDREPDRKGSLDYILRKLGVLFNHQRIIAGQKTQLPTALDPKLIGPEALVQRALRDHPGTTDGFEDAALDMLVKMQLDGDRRRHMLSRLTRPDYPGLVKLIIDDLGYERSRGFGSMAIHQALLLDQLEECLLPKELKANLLNETQFVMTYLTKLRPGEDADPQTDAAVRQAYLDRLWAFVSRLNPSHNSLKACVLYHRLVHDRDMGVYDKDRFLTYIKLPRNVSYIAVEYMKQEENRRWAADLGANYQQQALLGAIGTDEPLVREYLAHFFVQEASYKPYAEWINDIYLKHLFAETKIVNGIGDMEQWYSMLPPEQYQALKERIDLEFAPTNRKFFGPQEPVVLDVYVKNVPKLLAKVYEVNTVNYYRATPREVDVDMNVDGLVANEEKAFQYDEPALRRVRRRFEFPNLKTRGTYIVEFIGSGKSSRAVIRKGKLRYVSRTSIAGQVLTVLDEASRKVADARVYLGAQEYKADKDGSITVPFSTNPGREALIVCQGDFASLDWLDHQSENYQLAAGIYVDRESLLTRKTAQVVVRPALYVNGTPVTLSILEEPVLVITSVDADNVGTTKEVHDFKLQEGKDSTYEFQVPKRLGRLGFVLKAKVKNVSQDKKVDLSTSRAFGLNGIDAGALTEDVHLTHAGGVYCLDVLGKTGEARPDRPVNLALKARDFRQPVQVTVQTDQGGRIALGALEGIVTVTAAVQGGASHTWELPRDACSLPQAVQTRAGEAVDLPYPGQAKEPSESKFSLLETRGGTFVTDWLKSVKVADGMLRIEGLPAGDYSLVLKDLGAGGQSVQIRIAAGAELEGYVLGENRHLQTDPHKPLQIASVQADADSVRIRLKNATKFARVHVMATRYLPDYPVYPLLGELPMPGLEAIDLGKLASRYESGRTIGEERQYILDRKYAKKYPGNMLTRASLLLNPWAIRTTDTGQQEAMGGEQFGRGGGKGESKRQAAMFRPAGEGVKIHSFADLDFLPAQSVVLVNLQADKDGVVTIPRKDLGAKQDLHVLAVDPAGAAYRQVSLPEVKVKFQDLSLQTGLDPQKHFTEQKQISVVGKDGKFVLADITTSEFEAYDTLGRVYSLYLTLSSNQTLAEFGFVLNWPKLKPEEKRAKYSEYACHELHFFLSKKDPEFFREAVQPYLKNKKDKTFLDRYLVGDDLSEYLQPWSYEQLNAVEKILLAQRIKDEAASTARHVKDLWELIPPDVERFNHLFKTALKSSSLDTGDAFGFGEAAAKMLEAKAATKTPPAPPAEMPAAPAAMAPPMADKAKDARLGAVEAERNALKDADRPARRARAEAGKELAEAAEEADGKGYFKADMGRRTAVRQLYRKLDKTKEWVEDNYYHLPIEQQNGALVTVNGFWRDYAAHDGKGPFLSPTLAEASRSFTEMMFALAVLDLPFEAGKHKPAYDKEKMTLEAASQLVVFHKEIKPAQPARKKVPILVSQNFFRHDDRYLQVGNEKIDKYVTEEFLTEVVYGCHVVITNPTSSRQKLDILVQIPMGAMPVLNGKYTNGVHVDLEPYRTQTLEYYFYFPQPGQCAQFPVHVAKDEELIAFASPATLNVVRELTKIDKTSWEWVSQNGTDADVLAYLEANNVERLDLTKIAWRVQQAAFFQKALALLTKRHVYDNTLWSYGLKHDDVGAAREYLKHSPFANECGSYIRTKLLTIDPVERKAYQHMEYSPLVNARAHQLGKRRRVLNQRFFEQYNRLLKVLTYRANLDDDDLMAVTYYLLLQDRVEEAIGFFQQVKAANLATKLQHDYFTAYVDFYVSDTKGARAVADKYKAYPVDRWRKAFENVSLQLDEIEGKGVKVADDKDREQTQTKLAATQAGLDFKVEARKITVDYQNIQSCRVNYYLMDIELLFSRSPFVQQYSDEFSYIRPNDTAEVALPADKTQLTFDLPAKYHSSNVMVELVAAGVRKSQAYYANSLAVQVIEPYGQVKVLRQEAQEKSGQALAKVYVKVYARMKDGQVKFYKDGYTDLRGRFDYTSLNTNELDYVDRFAILILSETDGAVVREASPPKR